MANELERLEQAADGELDVIVVSFHDDPARLEAQRTHLGVPFRFVADPELQLYGALGFGRGSVRRVWGWRAARRYATLLRSGARLQRTDEDTLQLGGDVIVDASARVIWRYAGQGPDDRPSIDELERALRTSR